MKPQRTPSQTERSHCELSSKPGQDTQSGELVNHCGKEL